ncbi:hypothetical protein [Streptomyces erythrochromogenes]|uniref:hypothetical protein n=1 Tax=Streptomyces erythrochromogenes TaxID=285574 RepID=UPI0037F27426
MDADGGTGGDADVVEAVAVAVAVAVAQGPAPEVEGFAGGVGDLHPLSIQGADSARLDRDKDVVGAFEDVTGCRRDALLAGEAPSPEIGCNRSFLGALVASGPSGRARRRLPSEPWVQVPTKFTA